MVVGVSFVAGLALWSWRGRVPGRGATIHAAINLVSTDRDDLACASDQSFGRRRCEFRAPRIRWPDPPAPADRLAAYFTLDGRLLIVPGLFEQPAVAARFAAEAASGLPRDLRHRFAASCRFELVDQLRDFHTRWLASGGWNHQDEAWVAIPSDCHVR
jgi:hypothetical protein